MPRKPKSTPIPETQAPVALAEFEELLAQFVESRFFWSARLDLREAADPFFVAAIAAAKDPAKVEQLSVLVEEARTLLQTHREDIYAGVVSPGPAKKPVTNWQALLAQKGDDLLATLRKNRAASAEGGGATVAVPDDAAEATPSPETVPAESAAAAETDDDPQLPPRTTVPVDAPSPEGDDSTDANAGAPSVPPPSAASERAAQDWPAPRALVEVSGPEFPMDALPPWLRQYVLELAEQTQIPPDAPAIWCLGALGAAAAKAVVVELQRGDRHFTTLWIALVLSSGGGKTPTLQEIRAPFDLYQAQLREAAQATAGVAETKIRVAKRKVLSLENQAAREEDADELERLIADAGKQREVIAQLERASLPTLTTGDPTQASLVQLMYGNDERILLITDEGDQLFTRLRGAEEIECLLQSYSSSTIERHRAGRRELRIQAPSLSVVMGIQPAAFAKVMSTRGFHDKGLLARLLFSVPATKSGPRKQQREGLSDASREAYRRQVHRSLALPVSNPLCFSLSQEAFEAFSAFAARVDDDLSQGELAEFREWGQKLRGVVARIAGILHVAEHDPEETLGTTISLETVQRAIAIAIYCQAHARIAFGPAIQSAEDADARKVLRWISDGEHKTFRYVDAMRALNGRLARTELKDALSRLVDDDYIRPTTSQPRVRGGRPPKADYRVHPLVLQNRRKKLT